MTQIERHDYEVSDQDMKEALRLAMARKAAGCLMVSPYDADREAHAQTIAKLRVAREALDSIEVYGSDTLSGRVKPDPSTYQEWLIGGVREIRNRARQAIAQITQETPE